MPTVSVHPNDNFILVKWTDNEHNKILIEKLEHFVLQAFQVGLLESQDYSVQTYKEARASSLRISIIEHFTNRLDIADIIHLLLGNGNDTLRLYAPKSTAKTKLINAIIAHSNATNLFELTSDQQLKPIDKDFEAMYLKALDENRKKLTITANYRLFGLSLETFLKIDGITRSLEPKCIAITGASGSGKSTLLLELKDAILKAGKTCEILYFDSFYKKQPNTTLEQREKTDYDSPNAVDMDLYLEVLRTLKSGKAVSIPCYSFAEHQRTDKTELKQPANYIIVDGIFTLHDARARALYHKMLYVKSDMDLVFIRRLLRDTHERGRSVDSVIQQYLATVRDNFFTFIEPVQQYADLVLANNDKYQFSINTEAVMKCILDEKPIAHTKPTFYSSRLFQAHKIQVSAAPDPSHIPSNASISLRTTKVNV